MNKMSMFFTEAQKKDRKKVAREENMKYSQ